MTEREMLEISKKEGAMLAATEALGKTIVDLKDELNSKRFEIEEFERELKLKGSLIEDLERELARAKGGKN